MHRNHKHWSAIALITFIAAVLFLFADFIFSADHTLFSMGGDGCKNVYTYLYQVLYGKGSWFTGMNYPYGEHLIFTDGQPALSLPLSWINRFLHLQPASLLAIIYYLIAVSFVTGMWYTYRLVTHFSVHPWLAIIAAVFIIVLSPQFFRIFGHFPLSYSCFLPMLFFFNVKYFETGGKKYLVYLSFLTFVFSLLHMYYLAMGLIWAAGYTGGYLFFKPERLPVKVRHLLLFGVSVAIPFILIQIYIILTDPVRDRPVYPLNASNTKIIRDLCTSSYSPVWMGLQQDGILKEIKDGSEGTAYLGIATMLMIGAGIYIYFRRKVKGLEAQRFFHPVWLFLAVSTLVFALGISAVWDLPLLRTLLRPFHQFRVPERFSWIFYYIMSIYAAVLLYHICLDIYRKGYRIVSAAILITVMGFWSIDVNGNLLYIRSETWTWHFFHDVFFSKDYPKWQSVLARKGYKPADFNSILCVPSIHVGSEKLWPGEDLPYTLTFAFMASLEMHIPIMDVMMSRTSWQQTFDAVRIESGLYGRKTIPPGFPENGHILLMRFKRYDINPDQQLLLESATLIGEHRDCYLYDLNVREFLNKNKAAQDACLSVARDMPGPDLVAGSRLPVYVQHFDNGAPRFLGMAPVPAIHRKDTVCASWVLPAVVDSQQYEFSAWSQFPDTGPRGNYFTMVFKDSLGREISRADALGKYSVDNEPGFWFRVNKFFYMPAGTRKIDFLVCNPDGDNYLFMDELLLRPVAAVVLSRSSRGDVMINNHYFKGGRN